jgi:hypothetical protein
VAKRKGRIAPAALPPAETAPVATDPHDVFRGAIVPLAKLADTINGWAREGYHLDDWILLEGVEGETWRGEDGGPRAYVWAVRET